MKQFVKENFVLVLGVLLPIMVIVFFGLATVIPRFFVQPPQYDLIFMTGYAGENGFQFDVVNGKIQAQYRCYGYSCSPSYKTQKLFQFDVKTKTLKEIKLPSFTLPQDTKTYSTAVTIPELAQLEINPSAKSPDGYQFNNARNGGGDIFSFLLFSGYRYQLSISKNGYTVLIPIDDNTYSYYDTKFIGWIIKKGN